MSARVSVLLAVTGPQGSGKGTQAALLSKRLGLPTISVGELFREHVRKGTTIGKLAEPYLKRGDYIPDVVTNELVGTLLTKEKYKRGVVLDGYPRTATQAEFLGSIADMVTIVYLDVSEKEVIRRLTGRRVCGNGHIYHITFNPPKKEGVCNIDGLPLAPRMDDTEEGIRRRLENHRNVTAPVLAFYTKRKELIRVNGEQSIEDVSKELFKKLEMA